MEEKERNELRKEIENLQTENANLRSEIDGYLETLISEIPDVWDDGYTVGKNSKNDDGYPKRRRYVTCMAAITKIQGDAL